MLELRAVPDERVPERRLQVLDQMVARRVRNSFEDPDEARAAAQGMLDRNASFMRFYDVVEGGSTVGTMVWSHVRAESEMGGLVLDEPDRAQELMPSLLELARADGSSSLGIAAVPGEAARERLAAAPGLVSRATNMALSLDGEIGDPGELELRPMTQDEFDTFLASSVESYIVELTSAGMTPESARELGEQQMAELIPAGLDSPGALFYTAWVGDTAVGILWLAVERPMAFVYDILVDESQRRRGYGEAIMNAAARRCRELGHPALGLNVFAHNPGARALYDKLGYRVIADFRTLDLDHAG